MSPLTPSQAVLGGEDNGVAPSPTQEPRALADILNAAADLIERVGWTQDQWARTADGSTAQQDGSDAACFCLWGAVQHVCGNDDSQTDDALAVFRAATGIQTYIEWNDTKGRTREEVVAALRQSAEYARDGSTPKDPTSRAEGVSK